MSTDTDHTPIWTRNLRKYLQPDSHAATHRVDWATRDDDCSGGNETKSGLNVRDLESGHTVDFVRVPRAVGGDELADLLRAAGYDLVDVRLVRAI